MRRSLGWILLCSGLLISVAQAAEGKLIKVLPHLLDAQGRNTLSPSLYERDAYQAYLRKHPELCTALRFDVQWRQRDSSPDKLKLKLELRTSKTSPAAPLTIESPVKSDGWFSTSTGLLVDGEKFKTMGDVIAWRVTLWDGDQQVSEHKSFLW